jgi:chromosome segregation protein
MEDVIFAGSKKAQAMNFAEVTLTFDNSEKRVSLPHKIISVTRRLTRGKQSNEYFINGDQARLKDIREITMESGMSKGSLAIISQGTISDIAQASPEERRKIFEDAAGVSQYKQRKKEALSKLEKTNESLEKLQSIVKELEKQVKPLERQAEKAKIYLEKTKSLKGVEIGLIVGDVKFFREKLALLNSELDGVNETRQDFENQINLISDSLESKTSYKLNLENEILILENKFRSVTEKLYKLDVQDSKDNQRRQMIIDGDVKVSTEIQISALKEQIIEFKTKILKYKN